MRAADHAWHDGPGGPYGIEDVAAVDGVAPTLDQIDEKVEIAGDERLFDAVAQQHAASRG